MRDAPARLQHAPSRASMPAIDIRALAARLPAHPRTRFAPSPTGFLHLGHVVNAIYVWGLARALGGEVVLRIEDHDRARSRAEFVDALLDDIAWLGFEVDVALDGTRAWRQSEHADAYAAAVAYLRDTGARLFWCDCSRRAILAATPALGGNETPYPMTCATRALTDAPGRGLRLHLPADAVAFDDGACGPHVQEPRAQCGALLLRDRDGFWTYQFAVTVDDVRHGIDLVVRGDDLLASTGRQIQLARMLGRVAPPVFVHHRLVRHPHGDKLSKSNRDSGVRDLRRAGWTPAAVIGHAAWLVGLIGRDEPVPAGDVHRLFGMSGRSSLQEPGTDGR